MTLFARVRRALTAREAPPSEPGPGELEQGMRAVVEAASKLQRRVHRLERRMEQLRLLRLDHASAGQSGYALRSLDPERTAQHVRQAVTNAIRIEDPIPHLVITDLWPADVQDAIVRTMPDPVFFEASTGGRDHLGVPPRLAPVAALVTWRFVSDLVRDALGPALARRFEGDIADAGGLQAATGTLLRRYGGDRGAPGEHGSAAALITVMDLLGPAARSAYGTVIGHTAPETAISLPFRPNSAVTTLASAARGYAVIPQENTEVVRVTYEFALVRETVVPRAAG